MKRQRNATAISTRRVKPKLSAPQAAAVRTEVSRQMARKTEFKVTDTQASFSVSTAGSSISLLNVISRGETGFNDFVGNQIMPKWLQVRYEVTVGTGQVRNMLRVMIVQSNLLGTPTPADLLQAINAQISPLSARNHDRQTNYKILHDELHAVNENGTPNIVRNIFIPGNKLRKVTFDDPGLNLTSGGISILTISDDAIVAFPAIAWYSRIKFSD